MTVHFPGVAEHHDSKHVPCPPSHVYFSRKGPYAGVFKRVFDVVFVLVSLPVVLPVVLILAAMIAADGGSPFYLQKRVGRNGKIFTMWKLRSMVHQADRRLQEHLDSDPDAREEWDNTQKLKTDPRITSFGRILRQSSMDELPQLLNVLKGDMSIVGPRPMLPEQQRMYPGPAYFGMRPGITGLWQISDRNECAFRDRAAYDQMYRRKVSLLSDMNIIAKTVRVVLRCTGY